MRHERADKPTTASRINNTGRKMRRQAKNNATNAALRRSFSSGGSASSALSAGLENLLTQCGCKKMQVSSVNAMGSECTRGGALKKYRESCQRLTRDIVLTQGRLARGVRW